jgi:polygalacturonase
MHDVKAFGAVGDGRSLDTAAIQRAIDACAGTGGTVLLRDGTFLCGTLKLCSALTFRIEQSATLLGSTRAADYPDLFPDTRNGQLRNCRKALLYTEGTAAVTITGGGTIDGQNWRFEHAQEREAARPMAIFCVGVERLTLRDFKVRGSAMWSVVSMEVTDLEISGLTVRSEGITRDGLVVVDCHRVAITDCDLDSGDDGICLKSHSDVGLRDVLVRDCTVQSNTNALKLGTPTYGPIENLVFQDISIRHARLAGIAVESIDGSHVRDLTFQRITMERVGAPFFVLLGRRGETPAGLPEKPAGSLAGLTLRDITAREVEASWGSVITGTLVNGVTHSLQNLRFENVTLACRGGAEVIPASPPEYAGQYPDPDRWGDVPAFGYWLRHVRGVTMVNCETRLIGTDARPPVHLEDVTDSSTPAAP